MQRCSRSKKKLNIFINHKPVSTTRQISEIFGNSGPQLPGLSHIKPKFLSDLSPRNVL